MEKQYWDQVISQIAQDHHTTPENVRREMMLAMEEAQRTKDPNARAKWDTIPRKGNKITLEEFLDYLLDAATGIS